MPLLSGVYFVMCTIKKLPSSRNMMEFSASHEKGIAAVFPLSGVFCYVR